MKPVLPAARDPAFVNLPSRRGRDGADDQRANRHHRGQNAGTGLVQPVHPQLHAKARPKPVYNGGPVSEDRGFIHRPKDYYESSIPDDRHIAVTTSKIF